ncbi:MAG: DNA recombination protein RmuC [Betaproteobacteria bacterium]|nr:DNA recombination protein RmuC [Betaproteobacteria bacterium]MBK9677127.1 DNA recombination protein RmuC [Betaproteobacteria bacterium]
MIDPLLFPIAVLACCIGLAVLLALAWSRLGALVAARDAAAREAGELRARVEALAAQSSNLERDVRGDLATARSESAAAAVAARAELATNLARFSQSLQQQLAGMASGQGEQMQHFGLRLAELTRTNQERLEAVRATVEQRLDVMRDENARKLDEIRVTVDEKLQATLEQRLGASFKQVSDRLEQVHKGLGEMQTLAAGVGDLKRVLANVKTRGGWGEVQLATLLAEMLTPAQYAANVATRPGSFDRVEFAIRLPGKGDTGVPCWLPIDAKFPLDHWQRLQDATERADLAVMDASRKALDEFFRNEAKKIRDKYVEPPHTTDFAILFVPTEGLYAEMMARPGFADTLQREQRVLLCGPMNLAALLNSLQMGFRTLAIEQRSSEVWKILGAVKTEFHRFGDVLAKTKDKIDQASRTIEDAGVRTRAIERHLRDVESLPEHDAVRIIGSIAPGADDGAGTP